MVSFTTLGIANQLLRFHSTSRRIRIGRGIVLKLLVMVAGFHLEAVSSFDGTRLRDDTWKAPDVPFFIY